MAWLLSLALEAESRREVRSAASLYRQRQGLCSGRTCFPAGSGAFVGYSWGWGDRFHPGDESGSPGSNLRQERCFTYGPCCRGRESTGGPVDKVENLIDDLWRQTLLLTDLRPPLTAGSPSMLCAATVCGPFPPPPMSLRG